MVPLIMIKRINTKEEVGKRKEEVGKEDHLILEDQILDMILI